MIGDYDAVLLVSFGGPDGPDDVVPFLENVTRGRGVPRERLEQVGQHYSLFGGVSPINGLCRELVAALEDVLKREGPDLPVYWGNRNWRPMLEETIGRMAEDGVRRAVAVATSAYSSYSACRQYLDDIERAREVVGEAAPVIEKIPPFWNHPGFIETMADNARAALGRLQGEGAERSTRLVFTAHSIPTAMAGTCDYEVELREASALVAERAAPGLDWELVYQSRSGPPGVPWLEPDVCDHLRAIRTAGVERAVLVPIGFVADHMEVVYDLDIEARDVADEIGLAISRAPAAGSAPRFVSGLREALVAHMEGREPAVLGTRRPSPDPCAPGCCAYTPRRAR
ncbi:MAG: ferrochelatase [Candidatus Binatia bacterium]